MTTIEALILGFLFAIFYYVLLRFRVRQLKNFILVLRGQLKEAEPGGKKAFARVRRNLKEAGYSDKEIEEEIASYFKKQKPEEEKQNNKFSDGMSFYQKIHYDK